MKAPAEAQVTDAEKVLIRALASSRQIQTAEDHLSARDGADRTKDAEFDLAALRAIKCGLRARSGCAP